MKLKTILLSHGIIRTAVVSDIFLRKSVQFLRYTKHNSLQKHKCMYMNENDKKAVLLSHIIFRNDSSCL